MTSLTDEPVTTAVQAGIDWAKDEHAVCIMDDHGSVMSRFSVLHTNQGITTLIRRLTTAAVTRIGIERGDGPVIDALLRPQAHQWVVYVIAPNKLKNLRSRYGAAGNKDDRFDAYVLADTVRTDAHRYIPLQPCSTATFALRATVRARQGLVRDRVAISNRLTAHLSLTVPGIIGLFSDLASPISLSFIEDFREC